MKNVTLFIMRNEEAAFVIPNITQLSVGFRLIYVEYVEDGNDRVRAFGRSEFDSLELEDVEDVKAIIPLKDGDFKKVDAKFEVEFEQDTFTEATDEDTIEE